ncbi:MAG TPA: FAD-dependent oxidoreductase, partial [Novosphingobium sp.]|nr:FAD-dependent oxidoreductase [Novosphingobium sp.]
MAAQTHSKVGIEPASLPPGEQPCDVVVVGAGAAGMTAALIAADLGLSVMVIEQSHLVGGTTAVSGGAVWVPANHHMTAAGAADSLEDARTYLRATLGNAFDAAKVDAYLATGPALIAYLESASRLAFRAGPLPDYYSSLPGGTPRWRALDPLPLPARALGADIDLLRPPHPQTIVFGTAFTTGEVGTILRKDRGWIGLVARRVAARYLDLAWLLRRRGSPRLTLGNALAARLLLSLRDRGVPVLTRTALRDLVSTDGRVAGVLAQRGGELIRIEARKGVILAGGGFGANAAMRAQWLPRSPDVDCGVAPADINTGEAIAAGIAAGAATDLMDEAWWIPVFRMPRAGITSGQFFDRAFPGSIIVNREGRRFANDAANYDEIGRAMANAAGAPGATFYPVFDETYRRKYIAGPLVPMPRIADGLLDADTRDLVASASSLAELAARTGIDGAALEDTVRRFNAFARSGRDEDFHRGEEPYERHYSDPRAEPNSTMAPITRPPFHAIPVRAGDIGTKGGLATNPDGQVLDRAGSVIPGLYAAGNTAASMM